MAAAESLLRERPFRDMTVDEVMRRTDLSRPSFYVYFRDRHHLVLRLVERIQTEMLAHADTWFKGGRDGPAEIRATLASVAVAYRQHGPVLQALSDAAADDERVQAVYETMIQVYVTAVSDHIERELAAGKALALDPTESAKAFVWMIERYLLRELGGGQAGEERERAAVETLCRILSRTVYGRE